MPHLHVSSQERNVTLHGVAATADDVRQLEDTVRAGKGVRGLNSHARVGLGPADTRSSRGRVTTSSEMRHELQTAAQDLDLDDQAQATGTALSVYLHRLPSTASLFGGPCGGRLAHSARSSPVSLS